MTRRSLLKALAGLGAVAALPGCQTPGTKPHRSRSKAVVLENQLPGTDDWLLTNTRIDPKTKYRCPWIEGYCSHTSIQAGETLDIFVSTNPVSDFTIDFYRMGYYGGTGGRHLLNLGPVPGIVQPDPEIGKNRLRECRWEKSISLKIPADWLSGVYVGKLTAAREGLQSYVIFIVRDDRKADFIFQCSDTTWQAYNRWPDNYSLYDNGASQWFWGPEIEISFDRPYGKYCQILDQPLSIGSGEFFLWEFPFVYWMESLGYDVTYVSNLDVHADASSLLRAKGFLSVGHDEYYSIEMFDGLKKAINDGLNVGFFSGNTCCGRIELHPGSSGSQNRIFTRTDFFGPRDEEEIKRFPAMALLPHKSPNANELIGARSVAPITGGADWICTLPDHWIFAGTEMKSGEGIPGLVGWEWHGDPANIAGLEIVATGITKNYAKGKEAEGIYTATIYPGPKKNFVFNASTCWWADGLSEPPGYMRPSVYTTPQGPDKRVQQITKNILDRML
ncbi:MAG: twin-arginine translocation signal domain-containing protein [Verrucomicrobia bacterium]|nr:twin-arginine translocation signal domain-containing protein [Verrucomicrobiota bacterium]